jgi:hypothetical protein
MGLRSLPAEATEGEGDELVPMWGSPGHGRRQRGGTAATEDSGGELLIARVLESGSQLESEGKKCGEGRGWCSPFYMGR